MNHARACMTIHATARLAVLCLLFFVAKTILWNSSLQMILVTEVEKKSETIEHGIGRIRSNESQIPQWMEDYFEWHSREVSKLSPSNYDQKNYLVMRCLHWDDRCGGAADRLQTIPVVVLAAYQMKRLLFIKWEKPCRLEEFLVPPKDGLNWTLPTWLDQKFRYQQGAAITNTKMISTSLESNDLLLQTRIQTSDYGEVHYNTNRPDGPVFTEVFRECWERLFEPSPAIAALVQESTSQLGLIPGNYTSVHIRTKYTADKSQNEILVENAVSCGSRMSKGQPIFIAADAQRAIQHAMEYGASKGATVVGRLGDEPILHVDRGANFLKRKKSPAFPVSAYYGAFVDFYIMAHSSCISFHIGGYGRWAHRLMQNKECVINHGKRTCEWKG